MERQHAANQGTDNLPLDLGDGLTLRRATVADIDALIDFNRRVHSDDGEPNDAIALSTAELLGKRRPHPTCGPEQFTVVVAPDGAIVSSLCLIPQRWLYAGVPLPATLVELVGTDPAWRNRGLVRRQFEVVHGWSAARGDLVQAIAGLPSYYRQFGYEYALDFGPGRIATRARLPKLVDGAEEPVRLRPATLDDAEWLAGLDADARDYWLVTSVRDAADWRYEIAGRDAGSDASAFVQVIEEHDGRRLGQVAYSLPDGDVAWIVSLALAPAVSWLRVMPSVLRHVRAAIDARPDGAARDPFVAFETGPEHPAYDALPDVLTEPRSRYALWVRAPDLPALLTRLAPVLEARLASSPAAGHTGELALNFYRSGARLTFTDGRLTGVRAERIDTGASAAFPGQTFTQLLFGYRSLDELNAWHADMAVASNDARVLLTALFPKRPSNVWPLW